MLTRRLVVKGTRDSIEPLLAKRGLRAVAWYGAPPMDWASRGTERVDVVETDNLATELCHWLCEEPHVAPYPIGALLWYSEPQGSRNAADEGSADA